MPSQADHQHQQLPQETQAHKQQWQSQEPAANNPSSQTTVAKPRGSVRSFYFAVIILL
jgi:hypothetical protein